MAAEYDRSTRSGRQIESERWDSLQQAVHHYRVDMAHALQVRDSAMELFSALKSVHQLPTEYREWLSAAAMLYEVGDYVNRNGRHRHAQYIISNSEILGYTPEQRRIIAAIARYLGKSRPRPETAALRDYCQSIRNTSPRLPCCCAWRASMNLGRSRAVQKARVSVRDGAVKMTLMSRRRVGVDLELWAIEKDRDYFRESSGGNFRPQPRKATGQFSG